MFGDLTDL